MHGNQNIGSKMAEAAAYRGIKKWEDVGYFLQAYIASGGVVTANPYRNNRVDVTEVAFSINDAVMSREATTFTTAVPNASYYLDVTKDGDWHWSTSHPSGTAGTDYLTIATVTTNGLGNVATITDTRGHVGGFLLKDEYGLENYATVAQLADIITYDVSSYCGDVSKSLAFQGFMDGLGDESKTVWIPKGKTLLLNQHFVIPSNTLVDGGGSIVFSGDSTANTWFNESLIAQKSDSAENIQVRNITITYNITVKSCSVFRFQRTNNIFFDNCTFKVQGSGTTSHNAAIDFWKGNTNVKVNNCRFFLNNPGASHGGAIWVQNRTVDVYDPEIIDSKNYEITGCYFESSCADEMLAVYSSGGPMTNVKVTKCTFRRLAGSLRNQTLTSLVLTASSVEVSNILFEDITIDVDAATTLNPEIVRIGTVDGTIPITDIVLNRVFIKGNIGNAVGMIALGGAHSGLIRDCVVDNTGALGTTGIQIIGTTKILLDNNKTWGFANASTSPAGTIKDKNALNGVVVDGISLISQSLLTNSGYLRLANSVVFEWAQYYVDVNGGAEKTFTVPLGWGVSGSLKHFTATVVNASGVVYDNLAISMRGSGLDQLIIRNPNTQFVTVKVFMLVQLNG